VPYPRSTDGIRALITPGVRLDQLRRSGEGLVEDGAEVLAIFKLDNIVSLTE
jgi:hypothetical protein